MTRQAIDHPAGLAAAATPAEPARLVWDERLRRRFWASMETDARRAEVFARRCGRHLVAAVAHRLAPRSRVWEMRARTAALAEVLLVAGYSLTLDGSDLVDPAATRRTLGAYSGFLGILDLPPRASIDAVFWVDGLAQVEAEEARTALAAARRTLCPGGHLVLAAPNDEELDYGLALCPGCGGLFHQWQHVSRYTPERLEALVRESGFEPLSVQQLELSDAAFRARSGLPRELIENPRLHAGNGETLVLVARRPRGARPTLGWRGRQGPRLPPASSPVDPRPIGWTRERIAAFWDGISATRLVDLGFGRQSGRHLLQVLKPWLVPGQRHLDYGAGNGDLAATLIGAGYATGTFEPSPQMQARQRERLGALPGFLGVVDSGTSETFDAVLLCEVVEHILDEDLDEVLARINRLLVPDGTLVVTTPNREDLDAATLTCPACDTRFHRWQHLRTLDACSLAALLGRHGFVPYAIHEVELTDAAFSATPYPELLLKASGSMRVGTGSTLIYIGRKAADSARMAETSATAIASPLAAELSRAARDVQETLTAIADATGSRETEAVVLTMSPPSVRELWDLRRIAGVGQVLGPAEPGVLGAAEPRPFIACDLTAGLLPPALSLPQDLVLVHASEPSAMPSALGRSLRRAGVRRVWPVAWRNRSWPLDEGEASLHSDDADPSSVPMWRRLRPVLRRTVPQPWRRAIGVLAAKGIALKDRLAPYVHRVQAPPLESLAPIRAPVDFASGPILHANNALAWGGVERQLVYVLKGLPGLANRAAALLCLRLQDGEDYRFYLPALQGSDVEARDIRDLAWAEGYLRRHLSESQCRNVARAIAPLPAEVRREVRRFLAEILDLRPYAVHAWQDATSISAGYAAALAGVQHIVLSSRNMRPTHFAYYKPYMRYGYRVLAGLSRVTLVNNSAAGAADYAGWIGIPTERFVVKRNGIDPGLFQRADETRIAEFRERLGVSRSAPLVGSVFRLYPEKRPLLWVEMAARVGRRHPDAHFVVFGTGPLVDEVRALADRLGLGERLHLPGTTREPHLAFSAMDVCVLASGFEGTPNVVLEAQLLGVPVVATDAGGTRESLDPGQTGWIVEKADPERLAERVCQVLEDDSWRARACALGPEFVARRFGLERMLRETCALYGLGPRAADPHGLVQTPEPSTPT